MKDPLEEASKEVTRKGAGISLLIVLAGLVLLGITRPSTIDTLAIIFGLVALIMLHEVGHYVAAKRSGMKVTEFFLGFGPRVWSFRRGETEYGVKAIPAGGYVRIIGMSNLEEVDPEDEPRTYRRAPFSSRLVTVLAGVTVNLVLAYILFYLALVGQGMPEPSTTVGAVGTDTPAQEVGLERGDRIVAIGGQPIEEWDDLRAALRHRADQPTTIVFERNGTQLEEVVTPIERSQTDDSGYLGVASREQYENSGLIGGLGDSLVVMWDTAKGTGEGLARLFSPAGVAEYSDNFTSDAPAEGSAASDERPRSIIGIVDIGGELVDGNVWALLALLGAINLIVALFNMIPLLPFDGGHAAVAIYEQIASKIRGREVRVDFAKLMPVTALVLIVFLTLGVSAMFLDVREIFSGN
jgi:membrane-associated protease RseP (regulator of RpoE activity)